MRDGDESGKKDLVKDRVRRMARESARDLVRNLGEKARKDVGERLKHLDRDRFLYDEVTYTPACGTGLDAPEGLEKGVVALFSQLAAGIRSSLRAGDLRQANRLLTRLYALPIDRLPQLRKQRETLYSEVYNI